MIGPQFASDAFPFLLATFVKTTFILTIAAGLAALLRKKSASVRHRVWMLALLAVFLLPALERSIPAWNSTPLVNGSRVWQAALPGGRVVTLALPPSINITVGPAAVPWEHAAAAIALAVWFIGLALMCGHFWIGLRNLRTVSRRSRPLTDPAIRETALRIARQFGVAAPLRLLITDDPETMPCTWGLFRPAILLPQDHANWSAERREMILAHEMAHISRRDWSLRLLAECARALYWFHPLVWFAVAKLQEESERACDDAVLHSGVAPDDYAGNLLALVRAAAAGSSSIEKTALAVARTTHLERRFTAMLDHSQDRRRPSRPAAILSAFTAALILLPLAAFRLPAQAVADPFSGVVTDAQGTALPNATVILTDAATHARSMTVSNRSGRFSFPALLPGSYDLRSVRTGFFDSDHATISLAAGQDAEENIVLNRASAGDSGTEPAPSGARPAISVAGSAQNSNLLVKVAPKYPNEAKAAAIQGIINLEASIDREGVPISLRVTDEGVDPSLARAAVEAVHQWRYQPTLLNGEPVETVTEIVVNFTLAQ